MNIVNLIKIKIRTYQKQNVKIWNNNILNSKFKNYKNNNINKNSKPSNNG